MLLKVYNKNHEKERHPEQVGWRSFRLSKGVEICQKVFYEEFGKFQPKFVVMTEGEERTLPHEKEVAA